MNDAPRYTTRVPAGRPVVVEPDIRRIARRYGRRLAVGIAMMALWIALAAIGLTTGAFDVDTPTLIAWLLGAVVVIIGVVLVIQRWRAESRGPLLVADDQGVWLRMGGTIKVRGLFLPWDTVEKVELVEYRRAAVLCVRSELGEATVRQKSDDLLMEVRRRRRWCDSSFAVHAWFTRAQLPDVLGRLHSLGGDRVQAQ
ncbi:hypothetical protein AB0I55_31325 [Actinocatenispora sera]|uniref:Uncharacterized protein n=1 Tax=Actinocatenispora sera TaxID=390989 RepID=A0A810L0E4_9ACTN|nr:hypothetical protein [Actinocatenispora sera]BCJ28132.1 hypothetical protein Asera_22400 [Actinocatenispora sera]